MGTPTTSRSGPAAEPTFRVSPRCRTSRWCSTTPVAGRCTSPGPVSSTGPTRRTSTPSRCRKTAARGGGVVRPRPSLWQRTARSGEQARATQRNNRKSPAFRRCGGAWGEAPDDRRRTPDRRKQGSVDDGTHAPHPPQVANVQGRGGGSSAADPPGRADMRSTTDPPDRVAMIRSVTAPMCLSHPEARDANIRTGTAPPRRSARCSQ